MTMPLFLEPDLPAEVPKPHLVVIRRPESTTIVFREPLTIEQAIGAGLITRRR
jgi:hypothetical protein